MNRNERRAEDVGFLGRAGIACLTQISSNVKIDKQLDVF
jgi:hypothetical protein